MALVSIDPTPNPNALKLTFDHAVHPSGHATFHSAAEAAHHPIAAPLLTIPGIRSVFLMANFCTVTKHATADWRTITPRIQSLLQDA